MNDWIPSLSAVVAMAMLARGHGKLGRRRRGRPPAACVLAIPLLGLAVFIAALVLGDKGTWCCAVCAREVERRLYFGTPVWSGAPEPADSRARAFKRWYDTDVGTEHDHAWIPVGCHFGRSGVRCHRHPASVYFRMLPQMADQELARWFVRKVADAPARQHRAMLRGFDVVPERAEPAADTIALEPRWLERHPDWR